MKIYVASSVANAESIPFQNLIRWLDEKGIEITFRWWETEVDINDESSMRHQAAHEFQAIHECDVYLMVLPGKMGAHVELGLALGMNKRVAIWRPCGYQHAGDYPCVFHYLNRVKRFDGSPVFHVHDWIRLAAFESWLDEGYSIVIRNGQPCICGRPFDWSGFDSCELPDWSSCGCGIVWSVDIMHDANPSATIYTGPLEEIEAWWIANVWDTECSS